MQNSKKCLKCGELKQMNEFYDNKLECIPCYREVDNNRQALRKIFKKPRRVRCTICSKVLIGDTKICLDHKHSIGGGTKSMRSYLCLNCNQGLGKFQDDVNLLKEAIKYLEFFNNPNVHLP